MVTSVFILVLITCEDSVDDGIKFVTDDASREEESVSVDFADSVVVSCCDSHFTLKFPLFPSDITETREHKQLCKLLNIVVSFQLYINSISKSKVVFPPVEKLAHFYQFLLE